MPEQPDVHAAPSGELVDEVLQRSETALREGARATRELRELERRAREAMDWRQQVQRHPWATVASALGLGVLVFLAFRRR